MTRTCHARAHVVCVGFSAVWLLYLPSHTPPTLTQTNTNAHTRPQHTLSRTNAPTRTTHTLAHSYTMYICLSCISLKTAQKADFKYERTTFNLWWQLHNFRNTHLYQCTDSCYVLTNIHMHAHAWPHWNVFPFMSLFFFGGAHAQSLRILGNGRTDSLGYWLQCTQLNVPSRPALKAGVGNVRDERRWRSATSTLPWKFYIPPN